jgi:hypothetical protein
MAGESDFQCPEKRSKYVGYDRLLFPKKEGDKIMQA